MMHGQQNFKNFLYHCRHENAFTSLQEMIEIWGCVTFEFGSVAIMKIVKVRLQEI
jgi:hypothetical protein